MKNISNTSATSVSKFLKNIISMLSSMAKAKTMLIRDKTNMLKARLTILSLLRNKKFSINSITHKIESILHHKHGDVDVDQKQAIALYNASTEGSSVQYLQSPQSHQPDQYQYYYNDYENDEVDKYPDLRHSLFDDEDELDLGDPNASVIDLVRNSKEEGEEFKLEDEIDQVADLFILKFHKRMKLQKLESFKRYQEMLQRGA